MRGRYLVTGVVFSLTLLWALAPALAQDEQPGRPAGDEKGVVTVTVFNTGDMHEKTGNLARIAGYVKQRKEKDPNVLLVDAGDFLDDGNLGEWPIKGTNGDAMMALMVVAGYDVCILGNHDRKLGKDRTLDLCLKHPKFPLVVCNINWDEKDKEKAKNIPRYKVFELEGVKVAVVGSCSGYSNHEHGTPFPAFHEREGYLQVLPEVRKKADVIVFISHRFEGSDQRLLNAWGENSPDVLIGGHSHKSFVWRRGKTLWIKAGALGNSLGQVTIKFDTAAKKIVSTDGRVLSVGKDWPVDEEVKALREKFMTPAPKQEQPKKDEKAAQPAGKQASRLAPMAMPVAMLATGLLWWFSSGYRCRRNADR